MKHAPCINPSVAKICATFQQQQQQLEFTTQHRQPLLAGSSFEFGDIGLVKHTTLPATLIPLCSVSQRYPPDHLAA